jgi:hypothetical protein
MARRSPSAAALALGVLCMVALAAAAATATAPPPAPPPAPAEKWEWRPCDDAAPHVDHALKVEDVRIEPYPIETGKPWALTVDLRHRGRREVRAGATMTLRVYALKHVLVYSTTQDFCASSKKKEEEERRDNEAGGFVNAIARRRRGEPPSAFVNTIARRRAGLRDDGGESGCPLRAGEKASLSFEGEWSAWAPESDKYALRVLVHSHDRPHPTNELMCVDVDVVARKPPSAAVAAS